MPSKTRTVEMAICFENSIWNDGYYVDIPFDTPEDKIEELGKSVLLGQFLSTDKVGVVHCWLYCAQVDDTDCNADSDYNGCCPDESCSGAVLDDECSHCGEDWKEEHGDNLR